jgi:2-polyprenyl-3-methyl-5-hydroxy-6-metoxy-1,4-benzoquinol methylase
VLDVGCGSGRVVKYLQEKGFEVSGIDISELAIETSKNLEPKIGCNGVIDLKFLKTL